MKTFELTPPEAIKYALSTKDVLHVNIMRQEPTRIDVKAMVLYMNNLTNFYKEQAERLDAENEALHKKLSVITYLKGGNDGN